MLSLVESDPQVACPTPFNLAEYVLEAGLKTPDKIALAVLGLGGAERLSFAALRQAVLGTARGLHDVGIAAGDTVLLRLGNSADFPIAYLAAIALDALPVPSSPQLTAAEISVMAAEISPAAIVAAPGIALPEFDAQIIDLPTLRAMRSLPPAEFRRGDPERAAYMVFTSGTSGKARAVVHAHRAIWARRMMWSGWYGLTESDRLLHAGAFNWTYTLGTGLMDPWAAGATALIPEPGITAAQLPLLLKRHDATLFAAAPGVYRQILRAPIAPMPKLRHGLSAGEKLPQSVQEAWEAATGTPIYEAFGMSECSTFISSAPGRPAPTGTLGYPQSGRRVAILGPVGPVPQGESGTIAIDRNDPGVFLRYHGQSEETAAVFRDGWFVTGDTGMMAPDGAITYLGRADDMMNAGGYRVSPLEVEAAMATHPAIQECAAVVQEVRADVHVIALHYVGAPVAEADLAAHAAAVLARYKQPRIFVRHDALPRGGNGKLKRAALRLDATGDLAKP